MLQSTFNLHLKSQDETIEFIKIVKRFMQDLQQFMTPFHEGEDSTKQMLYLGTIPIGKLKTAYENSSKISKNADS